jgi:predicted phage tail protein
MDTDANPEQHRSIARELAVEELERRGGRASREPPPAARVYQVPRRFGLGSLLVVTAFFCGLFAVMRFFRMPPLMMGYFGAQIVAAGVMQFILPKSPRGASALTGAILLPVLTIAYIAYHDGTLGPDDLIESLFCTVTGGALLGYSAGVLIAGVFMVMQVADEMISRKKTDDPEKGSPSDIDSRR